MEQESLSVFMRLRPIATLLQFWLILAEPPENRQVPFRK